LISHVRRRARIDLWNGASNDADGQSREWLMDCANEMPTLEDGRDQARGAHAAIESSSFALS
jgi:hypothetical protein